ncbi:MAG: 30S ribosome-binding factor RbfA [Bacteroidota bacterium]
MESKRQIKFGRQLQKDLAEIFQLDTHFYFGNSLVTITHVSVSPDLGLARVFLSVFPIKDKEAIFFRLDENKKEIRLKLGKKIGDRVRIIPELAFFHDDTEEKAAKIDNLIDSLNIPPKPDEEE